SAADHNATIRVSNHHHLTLLCIDQALGGGDVVTERRERVLNCDDVITVVLQQRDQVLEAACIGKGAVNQHDSGFRSRAGCCRGLLCGSYRLRTTAGGGEEKQA